MVVDHILRFDLLAHESPLLYCYFRELYLQQWEEQTSDNWPLCIKQGNVMWPSP